jgi:hypothetical protein
MSRVFNTFDSVLIRDNLIDISKDYRINNFLLMNILSNKKASNARENEVLAIIYALTLAEEISNHYQSPVTSFISDNVYSYADVPFGESEYLKICLLEGRSNDKTQYQGGAILNSTIDVRDAIIQSNKLYFYEGNNEKRINSLTVFDVVKSISDKFAYATNLKLLTDVRSLGIEQMLNYEHMNKK